MKISIGELRKLIREDGLDTLMRSSAGFGGASMGGSGSAQNEPLPGLGDENIEDDGKEQQEEPTQLGARQQRRDQGKLRRT